MATQVYYIEIDDNNAGQRIDNFLLSHFKRQVPKSLIYRKLRKGEVRVNKKRVKAEYRLQLGDQVRIPPITKPEQQADQTTLYRGHWLQKLAKAVLYEDDAVLAINKPSGLAVHGGSGVNVGLIEILRQQRPELKFLELVHRLDRDTSGCILLAKQRKALVDLHAQLRRHEMRKCYHAVVIGHWPKQVNKVDSPLKKNTLQSGERIVRVDRAEGKASVTTFQILKKSTDLTLIAAYPQTGRTHQIRVHCLYAGCPILGDEKYAPREKNRPLMKQYNVKRLCLHAYQLEFVSPVTDKKVTITAQYDQALHILVDQGPFS